MKLSTKTRHAITAMIDLAINDKVRPVTLAEISQSQGISLSYLEQLFAKLRKSGLVVGVRGPGGGYKLSRQPGEISIASIVSSIDDVVPPKQAQPTTNPDPAHNTAGQEPEQPLERKYMAHALWEELSGKIYAYLDSLTLQEFVDRPELDSLQPQRDQVNPRSHMYPNRSAA